MAFAAIGAIKKKVPRELKIIIKAFQNLFFIIPSYINFVYSFFKFLRLKAIEKNDFPISFSDRQALLKDRTTNTSFDRHYIYHVSWAIRVLRNLEAKQLVDVSSSLYFVGMVSSFLKVKFLDYRPPLLYLDNVDCQFGDLMALPFVNDSVEFLSCMHVVEHVGLGRYGDPINPEGDKVAAKELSRVLAPNGHLLFVVPVGRERIVFNAHRVYSFERILEYFSELQLVSFSLVTDNENQGLIENPSKELIKSQEFGCGCFLFKKAFK